MKFNHHNSKVQKDIEVHMIDCNYQQNSLLSNEGGIDLLEYMHNSLEDIFIRMLGLLNLQKFVD